MKNNIKKMDKPLFICVTILCVFGAVMIYSASSVSTILRYNLETYHFFLRQIIFVVASYVIGFLIVLNYQTRKYAKFSFFILTSSIAALVGLFLFASLTNDARSWYDLKFFSLQPSEFAKSALIIFSAISYNMLSKSKKFYLKHYLPVLGYGAIITLLVAAQPDLGSAIIISSISYLMFFSSTYAYKNINKIIISTLTLFIVGLFFFLTVGYNSLTETQLSRFNFFNPCENINENGYQVCNGYIAMNNGGLLGLGFGNSTQKYLYLPESHTDFIFPIIVEEVGLIAGIGVILLYLIILYRIIKIARESHNLRCSMLAYGTFWFITLHIIVNLFGVFGLMPLTGVPLPLLSYGGSSTVNFLIMIFVVLRVSIENKENSLELALRKI